MTRLLIRTTTAPSDDFAHAGAVSVPAPRYRAARWLPILLSAPVLGLVGLTAQPAAAHGGSTSKNYITTVTGIAPAVRGLTASATPDGNYLTITNQTGKTVTVLGYEHEPYLKITTHQVWQNVRAPTTYLNADLLGDMPDSVSADAPPAWQPISASNSYRFHDHRIHWGGAGLPAVVKANRSKPHLIATWTVPLLVGRTPVTINGTLRWKPSGIPEWAVVFVGVCVLLIAVFVVAMVVDHKRDRDDREKEDAKPSPGDLSPPAIPR
jgi:hypothetical protein